MTFTECARRISGVAELAGTYLFLQKTALSRGLSFLWSFAGSRLLSVALQLSCEALGSRRHGNDNNSGSGITIVRWTSIVFSPRVRGTSLMKWTRWLILLVCAWPTMKADGAVIYRQTFGRPDTPTTDMSPGVWGWADFDSAGAWNTVANVANSGINGSASGRPIDVANVNAGPNSDGTTGAYARGIHYFLGGIGTPVMSMTPQFSFNPDDYETVKFSWYEGNADATATMRLIVQAGGQWYAGATAFSTPATTLGAFAASAELKEVEYDRAAANWLTLNFDGSYNPGTDTGTNSSVALSLGAAPGSDLSGMITAFGVYVEGPGTRRFDTFEINAIVPEPASLLLVGAAGVGLALVRRRS